MPSRILLFWRNEYALCIWVVSATRAANFLCTLQFLQCRLHRCVPVQYNSRCRLPRFVFLLLYVYDEKFNDVLADLTLPVVSLLGNQTLVLQASLDSYGEAGYYAYDSHDGNITSRVFVTGSVNVNRTGTYMLNYSVFDAASNLGSTTRVVNVVDTLPPVIALVGSSLVDLVWGQAYIEPGFAAFDLVNGNLTSKVAVTFSHRLLAGSYSVNQVINCTYNVSDNSGNVALALRRIRIIDATPIITVNGSLSIQIEASLMPRAFVPPPVTAYQTRLGDISVDVHIQNPVTNNVLGTYQVVYFLTLGGIPQAANVTVNVLVVDDQPPIILVLGQSNIVVPLSSIYHDQGAFAYDDYYGNVTALLNITGVDGIDTKSAGAQYSVVYTCTDPSGNTATATRIVIVSYMPEASTSSALGSGGIWIIIIAVVALLLLVAIVILVIVVRRNRRLAKSNDAQRRSTNNSQAGAYQKQADVVMPMVANPLFATGEKWLVSDMKSDEAKAILASYAEIDGYFFVFPNQDRSSSQETSPMMLAVTFNGRVLTFSIEYNDGQFTINGVECRRDLKTLNRLIDALKLEAAYGIPTPLKATPSRDVAVLKKAPRDWNDGDVYTQVQLKPPAQQKMIVAEDPSHMYQTLMQVDEETGTPCVLLMHVKY